MNANQLRKWVRLHRQMATPMSNNDMATSASAFVLVVAIADCARVHASKSSTHAATTTIGVKLELECPGRDVALKGAMITALDAG